MRIEAALAAQTSTETPSEAERSAAVDFGLGTQLGARGRAIKKAAGAHAASD